MKSRSERCALTPILESEESQSSSGILHSELSSAASPGTPMAGSSPDDGLCRSPQPPETGDCEGKSSPFEFEVVDSGSPTTQLEHGKSPHDHVLDQQPMALPAESPPHKTAWPQTSKRHTKDNTEAEGHKRQRKQRDAPTPLDPSLPLWLVSLMHSIEEAAHHELVIE